MFMTVWLNFHPRCLKNVTAIFFRTVNDCLTKDELFFWWERLIFRVADFGSDIPLVKKEVVFDSEYVSDSCETEAWERVFLSF